MPLHDDVVAHAQARFLTQPAAPINASLLYALTWIVMWFGILYLMYRRGIIVKV